MERATESDPPKSTFEFANDAAELAVEAATPALLARVEADSAFWSAVEAAVAAEVETDDARVEADSALASAVLAFASAVEVFTATELARVLPLSPLLSAVTIRVD